VDEGGGGGAGTTILAGAGGLGKFATGVVGITGVVTLATAAVGGLAVMIGKNLADNTAKANEELANMGKVVNISTENMAGLGHAAAMQGEDIQGLQRVLTTLNDKMQQSLNDRVIRAKLKAIGIEAFDPLTGKVKSTLEAVFDMSAEMKRLGDTSERTAKFVDVFGNIQVGKTPQDTR
jgi:hypothetical protein